MKCVPYVLLLCCLCLTQCVSRKPHLPQGTNLSESERQQLIEKLLERDSAFKSGKILMRAKVVHGEDAATFRYAIVFEKPNKLRIETLPEVAAYTLGLYVSKAGHQLLLDTESKMAFQAGPERSILRSLLKLPLSEEDLVSLISSTLSKSEIESFKQEANASFVESGDGTISIVSADGHKLWVLDKESLMLTNVSIKSEFQGNELLQATMKDKLDTLPVVPHQIALVLPEERVSMNLEIVSFRTNEPVKEQMFDVPVPPGYTISEGPPPGIE